MRNVLLTTESIVFGGEQPGVYGGKGREVVEEIGESADVRRFFTRLQKSALSPSAWYLVW